MSVNDSVQEPGQDGLLSTDQAMELVRAMEQGDTGAAALETGAAPGSATEQETDQQGQEQASEADPANAVIMARDGKHTIPFEKLTEAREGEKHWRQQAQQEQQLREQALQELEALKAQAQERADAGQAPTQTDVNAEIAKQAIEAGIDPAVFGDMDEEGLANGVLTIAQQVAAQATKPLLDEIKALKEQLAPVQKRQADEVNQAHFASIRERHPDYESIGESQELAAWIGAQPSFVRDQMSLVVEKGTAAQVNELLDAFKAGTGRNQAAPQQDAQAAAKAAIAKAASATPVSLSAFPGGSAGPTHEFEALANLGPMELTDALERMSPEKREAFLNGSF